MSTDATTADDAALSEENTQRFLETFNSWKAGVARPGASGSESQKAEAVKCPYDSFLTAHEHNVLNTSSTIDQKVIRVTVGSDDNKHTFYVHEPLLEMHSPVFKSCLSRNWSEGIKGEIDLPEDDPKVFLMFVRFVYAGQILIIADDTLLWRQTTDGGFHRRDVAGDILIHSYIFADKYLASTFKNACIQGLIDRFMMGPAYFHAIRQNAELVYDKLLPSSALRRLYVDIWAWASTEEWHDDLGNDYHDIHTAPYEFWQDIAKAMTRTKDRLVKIPRDHIIVMHYPWVHDKMRYFERERAPEPDVPRPFDVDFAALSLQPEPSDD
ncbi:uncharacterized protein J3D65DRAFT_677517 [Phyllosticta citribraziliensis]|uniref:BTB domain-containing protein n=1 Tax=Phyllosticta citribraziliensis TaxID=989973 RepID=A0ABR1LQU9_9PEZI